MNWTDIVDFMFGVSAKRVRDVAVVAVLVVLATSWKPGVTLINAYLDARVHQVQQTVQQIVQDLPQSSLSPTAEPSRKRGEK